MALVEVQMVLESTGQHLTLTGLHWGAQQQCWKLGGCQSQAHTQRPSQSQSPLVDGYHQHRGLEGATSKVSRLLSLFCFVFGSLRQGLSV